MPKVEYHCDRCNFTFERVTLHDVESKPVRCPKCRRHDAAVLKRGPRLFKEISNFSRLAKDTN